MPPRTLFVSDLHLCEGTPDLVAMFLRFLEREIGADTRLYILGDFFEAWVGDDDPDLLWSTIALALDSAARRGATLYFMHGNRDFLVGADFLERAGLNLLEDPTIHELAGRPTLLTHGDRYSTADAAYQAFRRQSRDPVWQEALLARPLSERQALARALRAESLANAEHNALMGDAVEADVIADAMAFGVDRILHGHTHRPAVHEHPLPDGRRLERIVLADWRKSGEALELHDDGTLSRHLITKESP